MKNDLATAIIVAIIGAVIAFVGCNMLTGEMLPDKASIKTISNVEGVTTLATPDPEVFNYKSINPTVEVYVGDNKNCTRYDAEGNCIYEENTNGSNQSDQGNE